MGAWQAVTEYADNFGVALWSDPDKVLLALDFDGTLAGIVDDPEQSRLHEAAAEALGRLGSKLGQIAIVTGRAASVVRRLGALDGRTGLGNLVVLGQYGVERWDAASGIEAVPEVPESVSLARPMVERLVAECPVPGVVIEDKGRALGVHTRRSADPEAAFEALLPGMAKVAADHELQLEPGRNVLELRASTTTKGDAMRALVAETGATIVAFCGDDLGDLPAFEALLDLRDQGLTTCIVVSGSTEQPEVAAHADVLADGPDGVAAWLSHLADDLG